MILSGLWQQIERWRTYQMLFLHRLSILCPRKKRLLLPYGYWYYNVPNKCPPIAFLFFWASIRRTWAPHEQRRGVGLPGHCLLVGSHHLYSQPGNPSSMDSSSQSCAIPTLNIQLLHIWTLYLRPDGLWWDLLHLKFPCVPGVFT